MFRFQSIGKRMTCLTDSTKDSKQLNLWHFQYLLEMLVNYYDSNPTWIIPDYQTIVLKSAYERRDYPSTITIVTKLNRSDTVEHPANCYVLNSIFPLKREMKMIEIEFVR